MFYPIFQLEKNKFLIINPKICADTEQGAIEKAVTYSLLSGDITCNFCGEIKYIKKFDKRKSFTFNNGMEIYIIEGKPPEIFKDIEFKMSNGNDTIGVTVGIDSDDGSPFVVLAVNEKERIFTPTECREYSRELYFTGRNAEYVNSQSTPVQKVMVIEIDGILLDSDEALRLSEDLSKAASYSEIDSFYYNAMEEIYSNMPEEEVEAFIAALRTARKNYMERLNEQNQNADKEDKETSKGEKELYQAVQKAIDREKAANEQKSTS